MESFNGKLRDELLNRELFLSVPEARYVLDEWRLEYNHRRPHSDLKCQTPAAYAARLDDSKGRGRIACCICRVGTAGYPAAPLAEPDLWTAHPGLWVGISFEQQSLLRDRQDGMEACPLGPQRYQAPCEPGVWIGLRDSGQIASSPQPATPIGAAGCGSLAYATTNQVTVEITRSLLSADDDRPQSSSNVGVKAPEQFRSFRSTDSKVVEPSLQIAVQVLQALTQRLAVRSGRELPNAIVQTLLGASRNVNLDLTHAVGTKPKPQKMHLGRWGHFTLLVVYRQPQLLTAQGSDRKAAAREGRPARRSATRWLPSAARR